MFNDDYSVDELRAVEEHLADEYEIEQGFRWYYNAESCTPPGLTRRAFNAEDHWKKLQGERYQDWLDRNRPTMIWADDAGSGKTTNAALAAAARNRAHTVLFDKHAKAYEFRTDDATPNDYYHLKGGEQPLNDCCMEAAMRTPEGDTPECDQHGIPRDWPRMNPIYQLSKENDLRQKFEALMAGVGPRQALFILDDDGDLTEDNPWLAQFDELEEHNRVVGVHEYQTLKTAVGNRDLILDETPRLLAGERRVTVDELTKAHLRLEDLAAMGRNDDRKSDNLKTLAQFTAALRDEIASDGETLLSNLDTPTFNWETFFEVKDPISGYGTNEPLKAETLAQLKLTYNEGLVARIQDGEWNGETFCIDSLFTALIGAGMDADNEPIRQAVAVPATLESCPWCGGRLGNDNGARFCMSDECEWHEAENTVTRKDAPPARALAWMENDDEAGVGLRGALVSKVLPAADELPDPLVLDATATPAKVKALYGKENVVIAGDDPLDLDGKLNVTQVLDGQYHASTIEDTDSTQERIQSVIDTAGKLYDCPLFGVRGDLIPLFDFPDHGEVLKYHAARGLNRGECDAVVCIGAPHPNVDDLGRDAELLAMDRDDMRVGGDEYSTRRNAPNPPVYRKLLYQDENDDGLAVPTKAYSGLTGALFREGHSKELEQFIHRMRPLLVEGAAKDAYLLTNVPTDIPVDTTCRFDELAGDLSAVFPVCDGALRLLDYGRNALNSDNPDDCPDGFRPGTLVEQKADGELSNKVKGWHRLAQFNEEDVSIQTVYNWVHELEAVGLLRPESYEQHRGVSYTAEISTLKSALQVLSSNADFKVAAVRRFGAKVGASDGSLDWLTWARQTFGLSGDRCRWSSLSESGGGSPGGGDT